MKAILLLAAGMFSFQTMAQKINMPAPSPLQTITQKFGLGDVTIEYSRPAAKDRVVFGDLVPYGKVWRTGANAATKITFTDNVTLEGKDVKPGTYALYTVPNKDSWEVMLYSDLTLGGNVAEYKTENEVLRFKVTPMVIPMKIESFTINVADVEPTEAALTLMWENTMVSIQMTTDIDEKVLKSIEESMKSDKPDYFRAATYFFEKGKDLPQALTWVNKAIDENPTAFYMVLLKAKIEYKLGDKKAGMASAEKTIKLATEAKNADYVALANKLMSENK